MASRIRWVYLGTFDHNGGGFVVRRTGYERGEMNEEKRGGGKGGLVPGAYFGRAPVASEDAECKTDRKVCASVTWGE